MVRRLFACIYLFLLQHKSPSNISKGRKLPLPSDLPQNLLCRVIFFVIYTYFIHIHIYSTSADSRDQSAIFNNHSPSKNPSLGNVDSRDQSAMFSNHVPLFPMPIPTAYLPTASPPSQTIGSSMSCGPMNPALPAPLIPRLSTNTDPIPDNWSLFILGPDDDA